MSQKKILIIDDSNTNVVLLDVIFNDKGYKVYTANGAEEAFKLLEIEPPNVILLDILMPRVSGVEFLERLRQDERFKTLPVIVISAISDDDTLIKTQELGIVDYMMKPIDIDKLEEKVEYLFGLSDA